MTINALTMMNLRARGRTGGDCVALAITFATSTSYLDVEDFLKRVQSRYMSVDSTRARGIYVDRLFKHNPIIFGHKFERVNIPFGMISLYEFIRDNPCDMFIVTVPHHALVVKNGQQFDAIDTKQSVRVHEAWKVTKV